MAHRKVIIKGHEILGLYFKYDFWCDLFRSESIAVVENLGYDEAKVLQNLLGIGKNSLYFRLFSK